MRCADKIPWYTSYMFRRSRYYWAIIAAIFIIISKFIPQVLAVPPVFNMAVTHEITDSDAVDGDIMSLDKDGKLTRSKTEGDNMMFGVLAVNPVMVYKTNDALPLVRNGTAWANVTTAGGPIAIGDYITSSTLAGKGIRSPDMSGYMLGIALTAFDGKTEATPVTVDKKSVLQGRVLVSVGIGPASPILFRSGGGLLGTLKQIANAFLYNLSTSKQAERISRWILAALIAILVIYISFRTFGKNISKGIEAIGRNPLAKSSIQAMIVLNVVLILVVSIGGLILALVVAAM
jgi:hypothetical protein